LCEKTQSGKGINYKGRNKKWKRQGCIWHPWGGPLVLLALGFLSAIGCLWSFFLDNVWEMMAASKDFWKIMSILSLLLRDWAF
jgi:hypothetical protein